MALRLPSVSAFRRFSTGDGHKVCVPRANRDIFPIVAALPKNMRRAPAGTF
jgi:hypothetical protein